MNDNDKLKEKLDLLSALKEDEEIHGKRKKEKHIKKETPKKEKDLKKEQVLKEIKTVRKMTPKKNIFLTMISFLVLVASLTYLIYNIIKATNEVNQPYLIINSALLLFLSILFVLTGFLSNKNAKKLSCINIIAILGYTIFQFSVTSNAIKIPTLKTVGDFSNTSINEVIKWANENKIVLEQTYEYSDTTESDYIISQNIPANTLLKDVKKLEVIVSNGPNYESIVNLPGMIGWNIDDVVKKIKELKLNHVNIEYNFSETTDKDIAYEQSKSGEIRRNEEVIIKFSLGKEADLKPINLEDMNNLEEFDAVLWLKRNGIKYEVVYEFNNDIEVGKVIKTTPSPGTLIVQSETTVVITISKGPKIIAPNLMNMSLDEIAEWAIKNKITLAYDSEYSDKVKAGDIIRVSVQEGDTLEESDRIHITTSRGPLKMISYTDGDINSLRTFASENNLILTETEEFNDTIPKGQFISISIKPGDVINSGEEIKVVISLGTSTEIPNFIGMTDSKAKQTCNNLGLNCSFSYLYSSTTKGTIFNQNMNSGSKVIAGTSIVLTVSAGPRPNNTSNGSSSGSNNSTPPPVTCTEKNLGTLVIQESWLTPGSSSKTITSLKNNLSSKYPGVTFNIVTKEHNSMNSGLIHPNSPAIVGQTTILTCHTYTIYIVE